MTTIATIIIVIVSVIGISLFLTQTGWLNQNTTDKKPDSGSNGEIGDPETINNTVTPKEGTIVNTNGNQTVNEKQVLYSNVSAIIGMETKSIEANLPKPLSDNATHWITGTITLNEELMDANDDKYLNIKISGWYKFKHGSDWIPICEDRVGKSPLGEKMIIELPEPNEKEPSEDAEDKDGLSCGFINPYTKLNVELNNERSAYEKTVTLDLFVFSSTVVSTTKEG